MRLLYKLHKVVFSGFLNQTLNFTNTTARICQNNTGDGCNRAIRIVYRTGRLVIPTSLEEIQDIRQKIRGYLTVLLISTKAFKDHGYCRNGHRN